MFWLALKEAFEEGGWLQSKLEPALFYKYDDSGMFGIACAHVDDVLGDVIEGRGDPFAGLRQKCQLKSGSTGASFFADATTCRLQTNLARSTCGSTRGS